MHYKYSTILNVCFVTFMYGFGLPILFPVAVLSIAILYFVEKTMLYYSYKSPPMYDEKTFVMVLKVLMFAPFFYCAFGYWMCSSNQLLSNDYLFPLEYLQSTLKTEHLYTQVFMPKGWEAPAWPLLLLTFAIAFIIVFGWLTNRIFDKIAAKIKMDPSALEVEESLRSFWDVLSNKDIQWAIKEEENNRALGSPMPMMTEPNFNMLKTREHQIDSQHLMMGVHSYDILANSDYAQAFQYISNDVEDREMYIIDDDDDESNDGAQCNKTRIFLNLGYFHQEDRHEFKFTKEHFNSNTHATGYDANLLM